SRNVTGVQTCALPICTLSCAKQHRISSVGVELTPLAVLISKVRLNPLEDVDIAVELAERIASLETQRQTHSFPDELVFWIGKKRSEERRVGKESRVVE